MLESGTYRMVKLGVAVLHIRYNSVIGGIHIRRLQNCLIFHLRHPPYPHSVTDKWTEFTQPQLFGKFFEEPPFLPPADIICVCSLESFKIVNTSIYGTGFCWTTLHCRVNGEVHARNGNYVHESGDVSTFFILHIEHRANQHQHKDLYHPGYEMAKATYDILGGNSIE